MLEVALLGCGRIAKRHAELFGRQQIRGARLAAVCDLVPERAEAFARQYGVPAFTDLHRMMAEVPALGLVAILTPSGLHARHALELARYRKHLVVEKPMALTLADADAMLAAAAREGFRLFVVKQNRCNVPVQKAREALEEGRFGRLVLGTVRVRWCRRQDYYDQAPWRGTWALDGGVLSNQASHHVDLLQWMMGDIDSVHAQGATRLVRIEAEDTAVATLRFRSGALGIIEATTATRPRDLEGSLSLLGEAGTVEIGGFAVNEMKTWEFEPGRLEDASIRERFSVNPPNVYGFGHQAYLQNVVDSLLAGKPALVDGREGRRSLETLVALYQSMETGQPVALATPPHSRRLGQGPAAG